MWAWLVQIGQGRGGFYSYDLLENLSGLKIHSTHRIEARLQQLTPGDVIAVEPGGSGYTVVAVEPGRLLLLQLDGQGPGEMGAQFRVADAASTWAFTLQPQTGGRTRLIARWRARYPGPKSHSRLAFFIGIFLEPIQFFMERKMLLGIRQRAEKDHDALRSQDPM
ncbi:MAG: hypothetical protein IPK16_30070 [Anaerolineales bacterium]|nr:hypothetical protein [Anaerolineales bacterium]